MIKEFHVSENLFDESTIGQVQVTAQGAIRSGTNLGKLSAGTYTLSFTKSENATTIYCTAENNGVYSTTEITASPFNITVDGNTTIMIRTAGLDLNSTWADYGYTNIMFVFGLTPPSSFIPYGNTWNTKSYAKSITGAQTYTKFPIVLRTTDQSIPTWSVKGNTETSGTPSPQNPIMPNGVGEMSANLVSMSEPQGDGYVADSVIGINYQGQPQTISTPNFFVTEYIPVSAGTYYYYSDLYRATGANANFLFYNANKEFIDYTERQPAMEEQPVYELSSFSVPVNAAYMRMNIDKLSTKNCLYTSQLPSYEPYGQYKIPITNGGVTTNIYLSEPLYKIGDTADTINSDGTVTRRIGKVVLDGTENQWILYEVPAAPPAYHYALYQLYTNNSLSLGGIQYTSCYSNIAPYGFTSRTRQDGDLGVYLVTSGNEVAFQMEAAKSSFPDVTAWTTYLSQNPVTVYYIKETPTTEQITLPSIPTTSGLNTIDVNTTVKPSEMSLTYDGYKICKHKRKSANLFDYQDIESGSINTTGDDVDNPSQQRTHSYISVRPNTTYIISNINDAVRMHEYSDSGYIGSIVVSSSFTTSVSCRKIRFNGTAGNFLQDTMLNEGSTALPYAPYWE